MGVLVSLSHTLTKKFGKSHNHLHVRHNRFFTYFTYFQYSIKKPLISNYFPSALKATFNSKLTN